MGFLGLGCYFFFLKKKLLKMLSFLFMTKFNINTHVPLFLDRAMSFKWSNLWKCFSLIYRHDLLYVTEIGVNADIYWVVLFIFFQQLFFRIVCFIHVSGLDGWLVLYQSSNYFFFFYHVMVSVLMCYPLSNSSTGFIHNRSHP